MNILCISASNVELAKEHSASTHACELICEIIQADHPHTVEILPLLNTEMTPCRMCGNCLKVEACCRDEAFNQVYTRLRAADAVFIVVPHYAPIPSKVMMLLEKLEEMVFLRSSADPNYRFSLHQKPIGVVVHGGQGEDALPYYRTALLEPIANAFASLGMRVVGAGSAGEKGVAFGIRELYKPAGSIFVTITHDWGAVRQRLIPLVENVLGSV